MTEKKRRGWLWAVIILLAFAAFFKFALIGYDFTAYALTGVALAVALYRLLRGKKKLRILLTVLLCLGCLLFAALEIPVVTNARTDDDPEAEYLIVLGAGLHGKTPSRSLSDRLRGALDYLETYPDSVAIVSGGQGEGEDMTEAEAMYDWLTERGVAPERVLIEDRATSTMENLSFSLDIILERGGDTERVAIVSSEYHLFRAKRMAASLGIDEPLGVAAKTSLPFLKVNYFIREAFAVLYLYVFGGEA